MVDEQSVLPGQLDFGWNAPDDGEVEEQAALPETGKKSNNEMKKKSVKTSQAKQKTKSSAPAQPAAAKKTTKKKAAKKRSGQAAKKTTVAKPKASPATANKASGGKSKKKVATTTAATQPVVEVAVENKPKAPAFSYHEAVDAIPMKWGDQFPKVGFGFWKVEKENTAEVCRAAIEVGYRHLDCACDYGNEAEVGQGIAKAIDDGLCDREDLWVTSKLWNTYHAAEHVLPACQKSLQDLGLDYLDLYLIHFPIAQRYVPFDTNYPPGWFFDPNADQPVIEEARVPVSETWQAMEELAKSGLVRNIGICNFGTSQIRDLLSYAKIRPAVLQVETHPYLTQEKLLRFCQKEKVAYTAFSPLGAQSYFSLGMADPSEAVLKHAVIQRIAGEVGKTAAQVLLRWGVQRGTAVIPKTSSRERMIENIDVFGFELTQDQVAAISALDQGRRFNDPGHFGEAAFNTFLPIYE